MSKLVLSETRNRVRWITINRPERRNALDSETIFSLKDALGEAARDSDSRVLVLTGAGGAFCSGADLRAGRSEARPPGDVMEDGFNGVIPRDLEPAQAGHCGR